CATPFTTVVAGAMDYW
nr:immunoglobulin heavy chain junction region [Mus musculus]